MSSSDSSGAGLDVVGSACRHTGAIHMSCCDVIYTSSKTLQLQYFFISFWGCSFEYSPQWDGIYSTLIHQDPMFDLSVPLIFLKPCIFHRKRLHSTVLPQNW